MKKTTFDQKSQMIVEIGKTINRENIKDKIFQLTKFLKDKDELIRIEAIEALFKHSEHLQEDWINFLIEDKSSLVKSYAIELFAEASKSPEKIIDYLKNQKSSMVKLSCYIALYDLGKKEYLNFIIELLLKTKQYRVRSTCVKVLSFFANKKNAQKILEGFERAIKREASRAVKLTLEEEINYIQKKYN